MPDPIPTKSISAGDDIVVDPKNPISSTAVWGLIVILVNMGVQKLVAAGKFPSAAADVLGSAALEAIVYVIGFGLALYGRWRATRPLGIGGPMVTTVKCVLPLAVAFCVFGCGTSQSYKTLVNRTYPVVAGRMETYPLTAAERAEAQGLRDVSKDCNKVSFDAARPAWEAAEPDYRRYVGGDSGEHLLPGKSPAEQERRRADWLHTADILDAAQAQEAKHHKVLFGN